MGTRGAYGFRIDSEDKITYKHFDSYPTGLGVDVAEFIKGSTNAELYETARRVVLIDENKKATKAQQKAVRDFEKKNKIIISSTSVGSQSTDDWYCLLREAQGKLDLYKLGLEYMVDGKGFLQDSLFCEYAYIINVNTNKLEVYEGFNKKPNGKGRYAKLHRERDGKYYGVVLFKEISFDKVRKSNIIELMNELE